MNCINGSIFRVAVVALVAICTVVAAAPARADEATQRLKPYEDDVDRAVDAALLFLARSQQQCSRKDGSFEDWNGETNAVVGLAGMAFLAKGYRPNSKPYGDTINQTIDYILSTSTDNGYLGVRGGKMYEHGISTLYLSEVSGMVDAQRQEKIDRVLPLALKVILDAQKVEKTEGADNGAWRYEPDSKDSDLSVTGWNLMALRSARLGGAPVPESAIKDAVAFIERCQHPEGGFRYVPRQDWWYSRRGYWVRIPATPACTAAGILCRELTGHHGDEMNLRSAQWQMKQLTTDGFLPASHHEYATYYSSQAFFQLGGERWEDFAEAMYRYLLKRQQSDGSWYREGQGSVYPTAMYVLALTVSYRQLPIYQR